MQAHRPGHSNAAVIIPPAFRKPPGYPPHATLIDASSSRDNQPPPEQSAELRLHGFLDISSLGISRVPFTTCRTMTSSGPPQDATAAPCRERRRRNPHPIRYQ